MVSLRRFVQSIKLEWNEMAFLAKIWKNVRAVFKTIYKSDFNRSQAMLALTDESSLSQSSVTQEIIEFIRVAKLE